MDHRILRNSALAATLAAICASPLRAADSQSEIQNPKSKITRPFLWKIDGAQKPSFLFGTIHLTRPSVTNLPGSVTAALRSADAVCTEIPMDPATVLGMMPKMMLPAGESLSSTLPPDLHADALAALQRINPALDLQPFEQLKIWAVAAILVTLEDELANPGAAAMDSVIFQHAAERGKETGGIETPDEQLAVFDGFSTDEQIAMLRETLDQLGKLNAKGLSPADALVDAYLSGDLATLGAELDRWTSAGDPALAARLIDRLITRRNALMARRIAAKLRAHPGTGFFFAIGAAHLYGPQGVIALLEKEGFKLTRSK